MKIFFSFFHSANKIVLDQMNTINTNRKKKSILIFNSTQELFSHSVHWHKGQCPFSYGFNNVYNLTLLNHNIKNFDCRHRKQCLLLSHLRVSHNLNIKSAKKIVKAIMSSSIESKQKTSVENDIREIILFQKDDIVLNTNPYVKKNFIRRNSSSFFLLLEIFIMMIEDFDIIVH